MEQKPTIKHNIKKSPRTGDWRYMKPEVDKEKCIGCETCVPYCPEAAIEMKEYKKGAKPKADIDYDFCKGCGVCSRVCPAGAIKMTRNV